MPRTSLSPGEQLGPAISGIDWLNPTDAQKVRAEEDIHEVLTGLFCKCNGDRLAIDSVGTTISQRIRAKAIVRRLDTGMKEIAAARGVDIAVASAAEITIASTQDEINSLMAFETAISQETIEKVVSNAEMAVIEAEELAKSRKIRDPGWHKDLLQFITRTTPHMVQTGKTLAGIDVMQEIGIKLLTLIAEVDDDGEISCWMMEEPAVSDA